MGKVLFMRGLTLAEISVQCAQSASQAVTAELWPERSASEHQRLEDRSLEVEVLKSVKASFASSFREESRAPAGRTGAGISQPTWIAAKNP